MNIEWIKNKSGEKFYPVTHSTAVLYDDTGKTVKEAIDEKGGSGGSSGVNAVKMNGSTKSPVDGVVDLGTVITSHQDISGKANATEAGYSLAVSGTSVSLKNKAGTVLSTITTQDTNSDTKVTQTAVTASDYTNWRPLVIGSSNSSTEGFTPSTVTDSTFTTSTITVQPSTGTIKANLKGNVNGYSINKSVPSNAVFTDTNTWRGIQNNLTSDSTTDSLSAAQGKALKALVDGKTSLTIGTTATTAAAGNHTHDYSSTYAAKSHTHDYAASNHTHSNYLTGITSSQVTSALGYTPYNSTNPNGYTSNAGTVTSVSVKMNGSSKGTVTSSGTIDLGTVLTSHQDISGKANASEAGYNLTVSGTSVSLKNKAGTVLSTITTQDTNTTYPFYGTNFYSTNGTTSMERDANAIWDNGMFYYNTNGPSTDLGATTNDGALYVQAFSSSWVAQIAQDYRTGNLFVRSKKDGVLQPWKRVANQNDPSIGIASKVKMEYNSSTESLDFIFS